MTNFRLTLQYDGTRYLGWQRPEKDGQTKTVSFRLASVLERLTGEPVTLFAGAKTEPGVHALEQTASFCTDSIPASEGAALLSDLNRYLPADIRILSCAPAPDRFRADLAARSCTYRYQACTAPVYDVFSFPYAAHLFPCPDIRAMEQAAAHLTGRHDFRAFSGVRKKKGTEKEIREITLHREGTDRQMLVITVTADSFLYRMPARIIGTLLEAGTGARTPESILPILDGTEEAGAPCDAKGLLLNSVQYPVQRPYALTLMPV